MPWMGVAALPIGAGLALHLWSKGCLEQNRRLTTAGPYRFVRNPFYLANALIETGLCLLIARWWIALPYAFLWQRAYRDTIDGEEACLRELFPDVYPRYVEAVPRLFPDGRRWPASAVTGAFSFENPGLARGQEYARLLGVVLGAFAIVAAAIVRARGLDLLEPSAAGARAVLLALPALWGVKLALAEAYRKPEAALLPGSNGGSSAPIAGALLFVSAGLATVAPELAVLVGAWALVAALDFRAASHVAAGAERVPWRYRSAAIAATIATGVALAVLRLG